MSLASKCTRSLGCVWLQDEEELLDEDGEPIPPPPPPPPLPPPPPVVTVHPIAKGFPPRLFVVYPTGDGYEVRELGVGGLVGGWRAGGHVAAWYVVTAAQNMPVLRHARNLGGAALGFAATS